MSSNHLPRHRLDAMIDAVLAITMTLLVLELGVPDALEHGVWDAIDELQPKLISWVISFLILAQFWKSQVHAFRGVEHVDNRLFRIMVLWLLFTTVLPFTTSLIGEHNEDIASHIIYAANLIVIELVVVARNLYLRGHPELYAPGEHVNAAGLGWSGAAAVTICALLSIAVAAYVSTDYASLSYVLLFPIGVVLGWGRKRQAAA